MHVLLTVEEIICSFSPAIAETVGGFSFHKKNIIVGIQYRTDIVPVLERLQIRIIQQARMCV